MTTIFSNNHHLENNENHRWTDFLSLVTAREQASSATSFGAEASPLSPNNNINSKLSMCLAATNNPKVTKKRFSDDPPSACYGRTIKKAKYTAPITGAEEAGLVASDGSLLPLGALTSAAALLQPGMAHQLLMTGGRCPPAAAMTQQQMMTDIIASEMALLAASKSMANGGESLGLTRTYSNGDNDEDVACLNLGYEFLRSAPDSRLCDCGKSFCREIGYPNRGSSSFPSLNPAAVNGWCQALNITDPAQITRIQLNPGGFRVAYWHFQNTQRHSKGNNGGVVVHSSTGLPDASLQSFVDTITMKSSSRTVVKEPSQRMVDLHNYWAQVRRSPTLEP